MHDEIATEEIATGGDCEPIDAVRLEIAETKAKALDTIHTITGLLRDGVDQEAYFTSALSKMTDVLTALNDVTRTMDYAAREANR